MSPLRVSLESALLALYLWPALMWTRDRIPSSLSLKVKISYYFPLLFGPPPRPGFHSSKN